MNKFARGRRLASCSTSSMCASTLLGSGLAISLAFREMKRTGEWGKIKTTGLPTIRVAQLPEPDRQIVALLDGRSGTL